MLELRKVLQYLGEEQSLDAIKIEWEKSQAVFPTGDLAFLMPEEVRSNLYYCGFGADALEPALHAAAYIRSDPNLTALAWHCYWRLYHSNDPAIHWFIGWPQLRQVLGSNSGLFPLLVGIAMAPLVREFHKKMEIPDKITRETCLEPYSYSLNYKEMTGGELGLIWSQLFWLRHYTREKYFRLGRFEFWLKPLGMDFRVYRNRNTGEVAALAQDEACYDATGLSVNDQECELPGQWHAQFRAADNQVIGNIIHPRGYVISQPVTLDLNEWQLILQPGDWVLDMHIPAGGGMTPALVHTSFHRAAEFFPRFFPTMAPRAYVCSSWIYNPGLVDILPPESNLVSNLSDAYLVPVVSGPEDGLGFMFYQEKFDAQTAPRKTSLQRAILDFLSRGGRWRCGGMFYLLEDLDMLGTGFYQALWRLSK
jgi:hypothetical protein